MYVSYSCTQTHTVRKENLQLLKAFFDRPSFEVSSHRSILKEKWVFFVEFYFAIPGTYIQGLKRCSNTVLYYKLLPGCQRPASRGCGGHLEAAIESFSGQ